MEYICIAFTGTNGQALPRHLWVVRKATYFGFTITESTYMYPRMYMASISTRAYPRVHPFLKSLTMALALDRMSCMGLGNVLVRCDSFNYAAL